MKLKLLLVLLLWTSLHAETMITRDKEIRYAQQGKAYINRQETKNIKPIKLKKYFLALHREKPFIFTSDDVIYDLYLTAFLQKSRPLWLDNDKFVFHTSSNKHYLNRLKKQYETKYHLHLTLYKNRYFWKKTFKLRTVDREDLLQYIDAKIASYKTLKQKKKSAKKIQKALIIASIKKK